MTYLKLVTLIFELLQSVETAHKRELTVDDEAPEGATARRLHADVKRKLAHRRQDLLDALDVADQLRGVIYNHDTGGGDN